MSLEDAISALVNVAGITSLCGTNVANVELPQIADPTTRNQSLVYTVISMTPVLPIRAGDAVLKRARVQFDCSGRTPALARAVREALKAAINYQRGVFAGTTIQSIVLELEGTHGKNDQAMVFTIPVDYFINFYDA